MKMYAMAIGAGLGYLAGNQQARRKAFDLMKQAKASTPAKAVEERVTAKVTDIKSKGDRQIDLDDSSYSSGMSDPSYVAGADAVDPDEFMSAQGTTNHL